MQTAGGQLQGRCGPDTRQRIVGAVVAHRRPTTAVRVLKLPTTPGHASNDGASSSGSSHQVATSESSSGLWQYLPRLSWSRSSSAFSRGGPPSSAAAAVAEASVLTPLLQQQQQQQWPSSEPDLHPVLDLISARQSDGSSPGNRQDGAKLGLVVEGGGMRGIVTGAMLMTLLDLGFRDVFDVIYGASAGAINSTFYLSGQREGLDIYTEDLATSLRFLSLKRYWSRSPVMDLDYLLDEVMQQNTPLDWDAVLRSEIPLKVVASSLTTLRAEAFGSFTSKQDLVECLKASANVPEIVGPPRRHRGHELVDAAVFEPIPVKAALRDGCTHVLALCSRPPDAGPAWGRVLRRAVHNAVKYTVLNPPYMREAWRVEPLHTMHQGQPLDDLLAELHLQRSPGVSLDLSPASSRSSSGSSSPGSSSDGEGSLSEDAGWSGRGKAQGVTAADGVCGHILPVYPGPAAAFSPVCTHVETLLAGRAEGHAAMQRLMVPVARR